MENEPIHSKKIKKAIRIMIKIIIIIFIIIAIICIPILIEYYIRNPEITLFNFYTIFSKESWFEFIASYLGTIGTIVLGIIALYQNKKYKELSDQTETQFEEFQKDIKELVQTSNSLIKINTKIEETVYYPILNINQDIYINKPQDNNIELDYDNETFIVGIINSMDNGIMSLPQKAFYKQVIDKYYTLIYDLTNDGEKTIISFVFKSVVINDVKKVGTLYSRGTNINPGKSAHIVIAYPESVNNKIEENEINSLDLFFTMNNVLGESFTFHNHIMFYRDEEDIPVNYEITSDVVKKDNSQ